MPCHLQDFDVHIEGKVTLNSFLARLDNTGSV